MSRTKVIFSRIGEEDAIALKEVCKKMNDTPARIFRKLLLEWIRKHKNKI